MNKKLLVVLLVLVVVVSSAIVYFIHPFTVAISGRVDKGGAAIVDALSEPNPNPSFEETAMEYLSAAGMYVDVYGGSAVSVDFMKSFPAGYELIIFRVHSATSRRGVFYFTSEPYDESKYQPEQFRDELRPAKDYEGHGHVFAFGPKFVDTYLRDRFRNAIVIGMGCFGAGTSYGTEEEVTVEDVQVENGPNLAEAFHRQGAVATIGWDKLVTLQSCDRASLALIRALAVDHLPVRRAVETINLQLGPDPVYKSVLHYCPEENGDYLLQSRPPQEKPLDALTLKDEVLCPPTNLPYWLVQSSRLLTSSSRSSSS